MRTPLIAANWKMNNGLEETKDFINSFVPMVRETEGVDVVIAPPYTSLVTAAELLQNSGIRLAAQNVFYEEKGAYTGEISPAMLVSIGCSCVIIGHSERRQYFNESDDIVNKKIHNARKGGLEVILCIGESLEDRENNRTFEVLERQLTGSLKDVQLEGITIAYEPIWAIGTGKTATPEQADATHTFIREWLRKYAKGAEAVRILYGGSVTPDNIGLLIEKPDIDGALVGGASLKPDSFAKIVTGATQ